MTCRDARSRNEPDTYKHPDDSFYGEIDADSMLELIDLNRRDIFGEEGLRYVDLGRRLEASGVR